MTILTKFSALAGGALALMASPAAAQVVSWSYRGGFQGGGGGRPRPPMHQVPEIDASAGLLALAAVAAVMLFVWERRRREVRG